MPLPEGMIEGAFERAYQARPSPAELARKNAGQAAQNAWTNQGGEEYRRTPAPSPAKGEPSSPPPAE